MLEAFETQWRACRSGSAVMPDLKAFLATANPRVQPMTLIVDLAEDAMPVRLCGTGMAELMGADFTGGDYLTAVREPARKRVLSREWRCARHPCGMRLRLVGRTLNGRLFADTVAVLPVTRGSDAFSLVRVSQVEALDTWQAGEMAVIGYQDAAWIDIGAGVPKDRPWTEPVTEIA